MLPQDIDKSRIVLTPKQQKKLLRFAKIVEDGDVALVEELDALEDRVEEANSKSDRAISIAEEVKKMEGPIGPEGKDGRDGEEGSPGKDGEPGKDGQDGKDGVNGKDAPTVDTSNLALEASTEAIAELLPLIPTIEEIEADLPKLGEPIRDGLELLKGDERLDISAIKGVGKRLAKLSTDIINRAIGILDSRTSFLINKVSNLQAALDGKANGLTADQNYVTDAQITVIENTSGVNTGDQIIPTLASGVYAPDITLEINLDATTTITEAQYMRVGSTVTVSGRFNANPTLTATMTSFEIDLPVVSNIGAVEDVAGVAFSSAIAGMGAGIFGVVANDTAKISWVASDINAQNWSYQFTYQII